jgi:hypothetical protein
MKSQKPKLGRPPLPRAQKQRHRAICHLDVGDKDALAAASSARGQSESEILRAGLVALGVLTARDHEPAQT